MDCSSIIQKALGEIMYGKLYCSNKFVSHKLVDKSLNCILLISTIRTKGLDWASNGQNIVQAGISAWRRYFLLIWNERWKGFNPFLPRAPAVWTYASFKVKRWEQKKKGLSSALDPSSVFVHPNHVIKLFYGSDNKICRMAWISDIFPSKITGKIYISVIIIKKKK